MERIELNCFDSSYDLTDGVTVVEESGDWLEIREEGIFYVDNLHTLGARTVDAYKEIMPEYFEHTSNEHKVTRQQAISLVEVTTGSANDIFLLKECN